MDLNYLDLLIHLATELKRKRLNVLRLNERLSLTFPRFCLRTLYPDPNAHV